MPELPEVQTTVAGIRPYLVDQQIEKIIIRDRRLRWPIPEQQIKKQLPQTIISVERRAKYILIQLTAGTLIIHLGMSGTLRIVDKRVAVRKHDHVDCYLSSGKILRYHDPRRFGAFLFAEDLTEHPLFKHLGPEPLSKAFTPSILWQKAQSRKTAVKTFIMDQQVVVGVGNIYASESLFIAKIHPLMPAKQLTLAQAKALHQAIQQVLRQAIKKGGTTLKDFTQSDGKPGYFSQSLQVYDREGLACVRCQKPIMQLKIGQRASYFCAHCQK